MAGSAWGRHAGGHDLHPHRPAAYGRAASGLHCRPCERALLCSTHAHIRVCRCVLQTVAWVGRPTHQQLLSQNRRPSLQEGDRYHRRPSAALHRAHYAHRRRRRGDRIVHCGSRLLHLRSLLLPALSQRSPHHQRAMQAAIAAPRLGASGARRPAASAGRPAAAGLGCRRLAVRMGATGGQQVRVGPWVVQRRRLRRQPPAAFRTTLQGHTLGRWPRQRGLLSAPHLACRPICRRCFPCPPAPLPTGQPPRCRPAPACRTRPRSAGGARWPTCLTTSTCPPTPRPTSP